MGLLTMKVDKKNYHKYLKLLSVNEDDKISKNSVGIGMGLSVAKAILKQLGPKDMAQIFVESKYNCGS